MSRIGKLPIAIPPGVDVKIADNNEISVKGPKGTLSRRLVPDMTVKQDGPVLTISRPNDLKRSKSLHGLTRSLVANMVKGVTDGYKKNLELVGTGYRAAKDGNKLTLTLGYSHPIVMVDPEGVTSQVDGNTKITISGYDKEKVGQYAADIRSKRPPEPFNGKGVKYADEHIIRKAGKAGKTAKK